MLDYEQIKEIINKIDSSSLRVFELEHKDIKLKLSKNSEIILSNGRENMVDEEINIVDISDSDNISQSEIESKGKIEKNSSNLKSVKSPLVGTFYSSDIPNGDPYVTVGSKVKKGETLCIIEAMKVMNEITSEYDGEIVEVLVKDEEIVEYGKDLFKIKEI